MAKVFLKIGYQTLLLPSEQGLTTILKALAGAVQVSDRRHRDNTVEIEDSNPVQVEASLLGPKTKVITKQDA